MKKLKIESSPADQSISDATDSLDGTSVKQAPFHDSVRNPPRPSPERPWRRESYQFGTPLAAGYAPESESPVKQAPFQDGEINPPWRSPSRPWRRESYRFGTPLAAGYAENESETPVQEPQQRPEWQKPVPGRQLSPTSHSPGAKKTVKPSAAVRTVIEVELAGLRAVWQLYRSTSSRDAVYIYLEALFALVTRWRGLGCAMKNSRAALRLKPHAPQMKPEPFARVIFCTCDPEVADFKTRSKWSRALRFAQKAKPSDQRLIDFIKSNGGLNACAQLFARGSKP